MEILVVDDQVAVVNGIERGIQWEKIGILKVWKTYNAIDAKAIIQNKNIDILLCDIEMPEESGLSLCRWIKQNGYEVECLLLTAHADFVFAREAVSLGVFDYILQPARYEEIQDILLKAVNRIKERRKAKNFSDLGKKVYSKKQIILEDIIKKWVREETIGSDEVIRELRTFDYSVAEENMVCCSLIQILEWKDMNKKLDKTLFGFVTGNIVQELLDDFPVSVICTCLDRDIFSCMIIGDKGVMPQILDMKRQLARYIDVIFQLYSCKTVCFLDGIVEFECAAEKINNLDEIRLVNEKRESNVYCIYDHEWMRNTNTKNTETFEDEQDAYVEEVIRYIQCNIEQPLCRADIAGVVNLNEDYLSRLFKHKKGVSLKEFIINEKMTVAKKLLQTTKLPIGVIAAKVGYDNFSHFSSTYRKIMGIAPIEERN
ncbi:MAG: response regulator [Roseburia sp.]|nr:response regulator [Roseburia sp.]